MLNGINPVIIFHFQKLTFEEQALLEGAIPIAAKVPSYVEQPWIPIYFNENEIGLMLGEESKSVDIQTVTEGKTEGSAPDVIQKPVSSSVSINLEGDKDSLGLALLSAMIDLIFEKVVSREYSISYLHGATTIFHGQLQNFSANQSPADSRVFIKLELSKGTKNPEKPDTTPQAPAKSGLSL